MKILNLKAEKKFALMVIVLGVGIILLYGSKIFSLHTVWELGDEAGYLWNAAYFTGTDWSSFASVYAYSGYGYSVILIPLFWIARNGIQLIRGAYIINIMYANTIYCISGLYNTICSIKCIKGFMRNIPDILVFLFGFIIIFIY